MKASRFNIFVDLDEGRRLLFNSLSGALAELTAESYDQVANIFSSSGSDLAPAQKGLAEQLEYGGFLVKEETDEIAELKVGDAQRRFSGSLFSLGICPTFECNLACPYCEGRKNRGRITRSVEKALMGHAEMFIRKCDAIDLTWFGGEPLLCIETIERVQTAFSEQAQKYGVNLAASTVITNGTLLDTKMATRLKDVGVSSVQVTIDGPAESHDSSRRLDGDTGTYERVIENIRNCTEIFEVVVRINVDGHGASSLSSVCDTLGTRGILPQSRMYFGTSRSRQAVCADVTGRCCLTEEQARIHLDLYRSLLDHKSCRMDFPYLTPRGVCGLDSASSMLVAPTGYIYKSWKDLSPSVDASVGSLFASELETFQQTNLWPYISRDFFDNQECRECQALPGCLGSCVSSDIDAVAGLCSPWRKHYQDLITLRYMYNKQEEVIE